MDEQVKKNLAYHYTSLETFLKILDGIKNDTISFHATGIFSLNDPIEYKYGFEKIMDYLPKVEEILQVKEEQKLSKIWNKDNTLTEKELKDKYMYELQNQFLYPFVVSLSRCEDSLSMWNMYGDNGKGVAIGLDIRIYYIERRKKNDVRQLDMTHLCLDSMYSVDVDYGDFVSWESLELFIRYYYNLYNKRVEDVPNEELFKCQVVAITNMMMYAAPLIKHPSYSGEQESRLYMRQDDLNKILFKHSSRRGIVPYVELKIPTSKLKRIIIGPCCDFENVKNCIDIRFQQLGITDYEIEQSKVPYRI